MEKTVSLVATGLSDGQQIVPPPYETRRYINTFTTARQIRDARCNISSYEGFVTFLHSLHAGILPFIGCR